MMVKIISFIRPILGKFRRICLHQLNKLCSTRHVNLGGGPWFGGFRWRNLEEVTSIINPRPFHFSPDCVFPFPDNSVETVYNSHNLEHLNQLTIDRVLKEAHRILEPGGYLVLKLPDFDYVLDRWREGDREYFNNWSYAPFDDTWKNRNIPDNVGNRAAYLFCGFWNEEYGDHFSNNISNNSMAYHGPPVVSPEVLNKLKMYDSPRQISKELCDYVHETESTYSFNHQSAWSRDELRELIAQKDFRVVSMDMENVLKECSYVPDIRIMGNISMYLLGEKPK